MKRFLFFIAISLVALFSFSCGSTKVENEKSDETKISSPTYEGDDEVEDVIEYSDEYLRSTKNISSKENVTVDEFEKDKTEILQIIDELSEVMKKKNKDKWLTYIDSESIDYYSNTTNLRKVREKLPNKQIQLHGIGDYFKYVFIPARENNKVDEIRYISKTNIKAVEVKDDGTELIYYYFVKKDGKWYVNIPKLSD